MRALFPRLTGLALLVLFLVWAWSARTAFGPWAFSLTGEEQFFQQVLGLWQLATDAIRPPLALAPDVPIRHNGVNPFGINTFLQQEVEPAKREQQVRLIADAGFYWLRQEFPWYDLEISGKGNFDDCRHGACVSAWEKYDQIVDLADQYNLHLIVRLSSPPDWTRADGSARGAFAPPDNFTDFADYAVAVAERYRGRAQYFQVWNEPNGNAEWGYQPVDPEAYTRLLCETYRRLKAVDPNNVVLAAALTPTNELQGALDTGATNLNDLIFLQRMYNAGAKDCFDIMSVQGYGLYSGPTDHRNRPIIINYGRNQFIRDLMVKNGDAQKALWISEMNWNAAPEGIAANFGRVTLEQQAQYAPLAYERAQAEWPWVGVNAFWFFKRADDSEKNQDWYYFRMADPDFTLQPVYESVASYIRTARRVYPGWYQEDHWAVSWTEDWVLQHDSRATFGQVLRGEQLSQRLRPGLGPEFSFAFEGAGLTLWILPDPTGGIIIGEVDGVMQIIRLPTIGEAPVPLVVARNLSPGEHRIVVKLQSGTIVLDGIQVHRPPANPLAMPLLTGLLGLLLVGLWWRARSR